MTDKISLKFWVAVDDNGDFAIDADKPADVVNNSSIGGVSGNVRVYEMRLELPKPAPIEATVVTVGDIPDNASTVSVSVETKTETT